MVEKLLSCSIKSLQTHGGGEYLSNRFQKFLGGGEYLSNRFQKFLSQHGISHHLSCPHTPEQNSVSE